MTAVDMGRAAGVADALILSGVSCWLYRATTDFPMVTSFATLSERTMMVVRVDTACGNYGWGEAYCNFPPHGGEHRMALFRSLVAPLLLGRRVDDPVGLFDDLTKRTRVLAHQTGEPGPLAQCVAAADMAVWDAWARREGRPLAALLSDRPRTHVNAYVTGLAPDNLAARIQTERARGHRAFKIKLGFGRDRDREAMRAARNAAGTLPVAVDPNQAWSIDEAATMAEILAPFEPLWLEEPLPADAPLGDWGALRKRCALDLAVGENLYSERAFLDAIGSSLFRYVQPDPIKWGGISGVARVARAAAAAGVTFCPHYVGSGLGFAACLHLVAALGGGGSMVEVDPNENPLREMLAQPYPVLAAGGYELSDAPGLGVTPDLSRAARYLVARWHAAQESDPAAIPACVEAHRRER